jgi:uncharacterized protein with von Willebrand factor type A (vWA) domain
MLIDFFLNLKKNGIPVTLAEFLTLLDALDNKLSIGNVEDFYFLARLCLVKDETHFDKFDRVFMEYFHGVSGTVAELGRDLPEEWLRRLADRFLSDEEKNQIQAMGGLDRLLETLRKRLEEQQERHEGGNRWIGTAGTSPFGAYGYNPEGIRIGQESSRHRQAVKVWDRREYRDLDDSIELGTRNFKMALRRLRTFAREGSQQELDLPGTIRATANNAGCLDLKMVAERHNATKVLLFLDVGGSMDPHVEICEQIFSAARSEFKHLEHFYFHNFFYEHVWRDNRRRRDQQLSTLELIRQFGADYKIIIVGDATMGPYEIHWPGGSVEHHNREPGSHWLKLILDQFRHSIWLNPVPQSHWNFTNSIKAIRQLIEGRMYPLTLEGLSEAIHILNK